MRFLADADVFAYMEKKDRRHLAVEVAQTNHSDIEITELYTRLVKAHFADYLVEKKNYRIYPLLAEDGTETDCFVLLPKYYMEIKEEVRFSIKKTWLFHKVEIDGIVL